MTKRCLLIIDLLNEYLDPWEADKVDRLIQNTNRLVAAFRSLQLPVIWVRQEFRLDLSDAFLEMRDKRIAVTIQGTRGALLHGGLDWRPSDATIIKKRYSAFFKTGLDELLAEFGIDELVLCGVNTHACIRTAAVDAYQRDFRVVLAKECVGSYDAEHARVSLDYMNGKIAKIATVSEIVEALGVI
ncbi:cysteine hydrolase [Mesorhizobium sp.]|uniref:cysteine hydrolase family protein n=1 Tax=Mesorhizobium sp. TaxID=1871066 RepID=UPI000FE8803E|nr:cysteine hydrolase [Mesorhizobium sp.]RWK60140.1 MAG: cysteine hydrolase [Mesorhizobium sp.]RWM49425.1 MAG: cysteine hydrolase [Mesorhizobium sp.]RWM53729.1 MAG: cysteine hydrolase [Mesorhizobium sp.]RWM54005.1 MAG: cysteine hydrolase [Mesorhizobium sp.]RWM93884.1 MAG: cysteine hydrolase [Mesorhizobium sp.]